MQACDGGVVIRQSLPSAHGSVSRHVRRVILGPATCEGLLIVIDAWTSDHTNVYKIG